MDEVVQDLQEHFGLQRIVFVGDGGMTDRAVRTALEAAGCGYLVGQPGRRNLRWSSCRCGTARQSGCGGTCTWRP